MWRVYVCEQRGDLIPLSSEFDEKESSHVLRGCLTRLQQSVRVGDLTLGRFKT